VQNFELVVGQTVDARSAVDELSLVAGLNGGWASTARLRRLRTLYSKRDCCHEFAVEDDNVETWLNLCRECGVAQVRHPLTVCWRWRRPAAAASGRRRRRRRRGTAQVGREMTAVRHRYDSAYTRWQTDARVQRLADSRISSKYEPLPTIITQRFLVFPVHAFPLP